MSMTLILWKAPVVDDADDADRLLRPWYETEDDSAFEPSEDIARAAEMLRSRWPDHYEADPPDDCPWSDMPFEQSDRLLAIHIRWGADDSAIAAIYVIAKKLELVLYDPQGPDVFLPTDPLDEPTEFPGFKLIDWLKIGAMVAALSAVTCAAWQIPHWIRWPAVLIAGFFALAAWFVLGCMIFGRRIMTSDAARADPCVRDRPPL